MKRTLALETATQNNKSVTLKGWVNSIRGHGKIVFFDLRDRSGLIQVVVENLKIELKPEYVVEVQGKVVKRGKGYTNPKLKTGTVEIKAEKIKVLTKSKEMPLPIDTDGLNIEEKIRQKYRYLDLRRPRMNQNMKIRSKVFKFIRDFLTNKDFVEIETPILTKTTPEGARDFLVPSRLQPGNFYALPQSPQQYKQLLMVAGFERYFQIARCFRDEDPRADRAYGEFTQLDLEMSFVTQDDILKLTEDLFTKLIKEIFPEKKISKSPWPRISHAEAQAKYGSDKPDLRKNKKDKDELAFAWIIDFPLFNKQSEEDFFHGSGKAEFAPSHHMFTSPHQDDLKLLKTNPLKVRGLQHDLVLNGYEVGGGSIRIHDPKVQEKVFELIGFTQKQKQKFEHMLTAFKHGVPPHGGIAPGLDRFLMVILGEKSIREVMAFPAISSGQTAVVDAPSLPDTEQLIELHIKTIGQKLSPKGLEVNQKIINLLDKHQLKYKTFEHQPVFTSLEAAKVRGTKIKQGAKALVMMADKKPIMLVLSAATKVDSKAFKKAFNVKDLRMATETEVTNLTGLKIGSVPPFGNLFDVSVFVDKKLGKNKKIVFNAGLHEKSIKMNYQDFIDLVNPKLGEFVN